jgi:hypothetical protein
MGLNSFRRQIVRSSVIRYAVFGCWILENRKKFFGETYPRKENSSADFKSVAGFHIGFQVFARGGCECCQPRNGAPHILRNNYRTGKQAEIFFAAIGEGQGRT